MTYIVGINKKEYNFSAIISDIMVTYKYPDGRVIRENTALKTGLLFKGCIYGVSGDADAAYSFLLRFKQRVNKRNDFDKNFEEFNSYIDDCKRTRCFERADFRILLSIRDPNPRFYIFNSKESCLQGCDRAVVTLDSGKRILDSIVFKGKDTADNLILQKMKSDKIPIVYYPCFFACGSLRPC